jgi:hypothetical protein
MSNARRTLVFVLLAAAAFVFAGCSSTVDMLPEALGGLPSDAPKRPETSLPSPNVYEVRPTRQTPLSNAEQKKLESDLMALRETEKQRANPPPPPPPTPAKQAAGKAPGGGKKAPAPAPAAAKKPADPLKLGN